MEGRRKFDVKNLYVATLLASLYRKLEVQSDANFCFFFQTDDYEMRPAVAGMWHGGYAQPPPSCYPYESSFGPQYPYDRYVRKFCAY